MLTQLASLKLTLILLLSFLLAILIAYNGQYSYLSLLFVPLSLLALNLVSAILINKAFKKNLALLLFHLTLLATVILLALSRLTYLDAHVELNEGETFNGELQGQTHGIFHQYNLYNGDFTNLAVQLQFTPNVAVTARRSRVLVHEKDGSYEFVVGEHNPLIINDYRFYVSKNIGYSAVFSWQAYPLNNANGLIEKGAINFPPFIARQFNQTNTWRIPNSDTELWFMLQPKEDLLAQRKSIELTPPSNHYIVVRRDNERKKLRVGQQLKLPEGVLTYHGLRVWMGFKVHYDPFKAYLLATSILTVLCLSWFFFEKFTRRSWLVPSKVDL